MPLIQPTSTFSLLENFDDGLLNTTGWTYFSRGGTLGSPDVTEHSGFLDIQNSVTDHGGNALLDLGAGVVDAQIQMDRYFHAANSYYFPGTSLEFTTSDGSKLVVALFMNKSAWGPDNLNDLNNFNHPKLIFADSSGNSTSFAANVLTSSFFDVWTTADVSIDNTLGQITFDLNSDGIAEFAISDSRLTGASLQKITFDGYGWFTGHYAYLDNLSIQGSNASAPLRTTADLFNQFGELGFAALLANAAYHLRSPEINISGINHQNGAADRLFEGLRDDVQMLSSTDIGPLQRLQTSVDFPQPGFVDGIYTNLNAAALVARSADAIFLSFRGTNDNNEDYSWLFGTIAPDTPDGHHWLARPQHWRLFAPLVQAIGNYLQNHTEIKDVYLSGHSLGASMVEAMMDYVSITNPIGYLAFSGVTMHAATFASPGFPGSPIISSGSFTNLWIEGDPILTPAFLTNNEGDPNFVHHNLDAVLVPAGKSGNLHFVSYYLEFSKFLEREGISVNQMNGAGLNGIDYDHFYVNATVSTDFSNIHAGVGVDFIYGQATKDVILGGGGRDFLYGGDNRDCLIGGDGVDRVRGDAHADFLFGGKGADFLYGGDGKDILTGGLDDDTFVYASNTEVEVTTSQADRITDFSLGDVIDLRQIDAVRTLGGIQAFSFIGTSAFGGVAGQLRYQKGAANTVVSADSDGDSAADMWIVLTTAVDLVSTSFLLL